MAVSSPSSTQVHLTLPDDEFCCPLCIEIFEEPKLLSNCAHSFCKKCLQELVLHTSSSQVCCPVCRKISSVPENGVDGFVTNSLLVRFIDHIPGRKERNALVMALARCKDEMEKNRKIQDKIDKKLNTIGENKEKGEKMKREISQHANDVIDSIRKCEQKLCKMVDESLERNGVSANFRENLVKHREKCRDHMDMASACVKTVEETLQRNNVGELVEVKTRMVEQLNEHSTSPSCLSFSEVDQVKDFNLEFKTDLQIKEDIFGKIIESAEVPESDQFGFPGATNGLAASHDLTSQIVTSVGLPFCPFRVAVCPSTGQIALLWEEKKQVHIYSQQGDHLNTISIKYGDLWDVGFTIDEEVVVVNRSHNRLLFYEKDGTFIPKEVEPPRDCLKFTSVSIDDNGRLIVTSTTTTDNDDDDDDDDDDEIIPCIIVYDGDCEESKMMFGRRYLERPVSRAIFRRGTFYVVDKRQDQIYIMCFTHQGQACFSCSLGCNSINTRVSLSEDKDVGQVVLCQSTDHNSYLIMIRLFEDCEITRTTQVFTDQLLFLQGEVVSVESGSITMAEIYCESESMTIRKHHF